MERKKRMKTAENKGSWKVNVLLLKFSHWLFIFNNLCASCHFRSLVCLLCTNRMPHYIIRAVAAGIISLSLSLRRCHTGERIHYFTFLSSRFTRIRFCVWEKNANISPFSVRWHILEANTVSAMAANEAVMAVAQYNSQREKCAGQTQTSERAEQKNWRINRWIC